MPVRVLLQFAKPTMRLAKPVWDSDGKPAAGRGSYLRDPMVRLLRSMGLQSVVIEDTDELPAWERIRELDQELRELDERFAQEQPGTPADALRHAIGRHLTRRAAQLERDPALAAMVPPEANESDDDTP